MSHTHIHKTHAIFPKIKVYESDSFAENKRTACIGQMFTTYPRILGCIIIIYSTMQLVTCVYRPMHNT